MSFATSARAHADDPEPTSEVPKDRPLQQAESQASEVPAYRTYQQGRTKQDRAYGWQTVTVDLSAIFGGAILAGANGTAGGVVIVGGYLLGAPIVHLAHGEVLRGVADVGLRVAAPELLGWLGFVALHRKTTDPEDPDDGGLVGAAIGVAVGVIVAIAIDASVLAYESGSGDDAGRSAAPPNAPLRAAISPMLARHTEGGAAYGVSVTLY